MALWDDTLGPVPYGNLPNTLALKLGSGTGTLLVRGKLTGQFSAAGISPGATGADNVLAVYAIPANTFDTEGRTIYLSAFGSFAANTNNKRLKIIFNPTAAVVGSTVSGGTTICDTGTVATNGTGWAIQANVYKYGAAGSNTQLGIHQQAQIGAAVASLLVPQALTATESGMILIAVTGNATTTATDILLNRLEIAAGN